MVDLNLSKPVEIFGVEYSHHTHNGDLFVTKYGEKFLQHLLPENWDDMNYFADNPNMKVRLPGSGAVYKITTPPIDGKTLDIVVKWCRVAQEVFVAKSSDVDFITDDEIFAASWNGPFEEFGLVEELRETNDFFDPEIRLQLPLAIYSPEKKIDLWRTGRSSSLFSLQNRLQSQNQADTDEPIELDIQRLYAMIYMWAEGKGVGEILVEKKECERLPELVKRIYENDIRGRGYSIADTKPEHIIVDVNRSGGELPTDKKGNLVYTLIDFELLRRTKDRETIHRKKQREKYWGIIAHKDEARELPYDKRLVEVLGVNYIFGTASNGGKLWVLGKDPRLFDYYDPIKWRRTPRHILSLTTSRTTSRDNIQLVYRRSLVNFTVPGEPDSGAFVFGYNSPFEEVAIATDFHRLGVPAVYPRAIYKTIHESNPAEFLHDDSRIISHSNFTINEELILDTNHDYLLLFGLWRGADPLRGYKEKGHWGIVDVEQAHDTGVLSDEERDQIVGSTLNRLKSAGFTIPINSDRFMLSFDDEELRKDGQGNYEVTISIDANRAYRRNILKRRHYKRLLNCFSKRIKEHGYEALDLGGEHILLNMDPDGRLMYDSDNNLEMVICNFELIKPPWHKGIYPYGKD